MSPSTEESARGNETILLVEDDEAVRTLLAGTLAQAGYTVLEAAHGAEALALSERYEGPIHLLVTDVVLPQVSGPELGGRLTVLRPGVKVLYISGHTDDVIARHGGLDKEMGFLQKPFTPEELARKVRGALESPS